MRGTTSAAKLKGEDFNGEFLLIVRFFEASRLSALSMTHTDEFYACQIKSKSRALKIHTNTKKVKKSKNLKNLKYSLKKTKHFSFLM